VFDENQWVSSKQAFALFITSENAYLHAEEMAAEMREDYMNSLANAV
jgi:hypothetical protein